ncbi:MAG: glycosyltransferase family 39 protein [Massilia sp.]
MTHDDSVKRQPESGPGKMDGKLKSAWWLGALLVLVYLAMRNAGLQAVVMADEWYYSSFTRLSSMAEARLPSYLYYLVFKATDRCGPGFLDCARLFNSVLFIGAMPFIYLASRRFLGARLASAVALLAALGPVNSYTAYFMPEASYYFAFWVLTWAAFRFCAAPGAAGALLLGVVLGAMALIKVHALFLLPGVALFMLYAALRDGRVAWRDAIAWLALAMLTAAVLRMGGGYLMAGPGGLSLSGSLYGAQAANSAARQAPLAALLALALANLRGHLLGLALLFAMPAAALIAHGLGWKRRGPGRALSPLAVYIALTLLPLIAVTVLFTASVAGNGQESNLRLHMRYYNFALPLLLMFGAAAMAQGAATVRRGVAVAAAVPVGVLLVFAIHTLMRPYTPSFVDSPELQGVTSSHAGFYILSLLTLLSLVCWVARPALGARVFLWGFMPVFTLLAGTVINHEVRRGGQVDLYGRAGDVARAYLNEAERNKLGIVAADPSGLFKAQFQVDNPKVWTHLQPVKEPIVPQTIPGSVRWLLMVGAYSTPAGATVHVQGREFALVRLSGATMGPRRIAFGAPNDLLERVEGLSGIEPWGRWSDAADVVLHLADELPARFTLRLRAEAYGPNAGQDMTVEVGQQRQTMRLAGSKTEVALDFATDGHEKAIRITVPQPASPQSLGKGADTRTLGIGLSEMEIVPLAPQ